MKRSVKGEVVASTFDEPTEDHTRVAEMALERAKRLVEAGRDVVILLDSHHAPRARLQPRPAGERQDALRRRRPGRALPAEALLRRRAQHRGRRQPRRSSPPASSTPAAAWTTSSTRSSRAPATWSCALDRKLSERRIFPAIDILRSGTRREELLLDENTLRMVWTMRRMLSARRARTRGSSCSCSDSARRRTTPSSWSRSARASRPPSGPDARRAPRRMIGRRPRRRPAWRGAGGCTLLGGLVGCGAAVADASISAVTVAEHPGTQRLGQPERWRVVPAPGSSTERRLRAEPRAPSWSPSTPATAAAWTGASRTRPDTRSSSARRR